MQITLTFIKEDNEINLMVDNKQKIYDTIKILQEKREFQNLDIENVTYVKSVRQNRRLSICCSYEEAGIYSGDVVEI